MQDPLNTPGARRLALWTLKLAQNPLVAFLIHTDPHLFAMMYASCAGAVKPPAELSADGYDRTDTTADDKVLGTIKDLQREFGERTSGQFAVLYLKGLAVLRAYRVDMDGLTRHLRGWKDLAKQKVNSETRQRCDGSRSNWSSRRSNPSRRGKCSPPKPG